MSSDFWTGVVNIGNIFGILLLSGMGTASQEGAGWSSLESLTGS